MANFLDADKIRKANEGLYNPGGRGIKETYAGIDRGANPKWGGWSIIDQIKKDNPGITTKGMNNALALNKDLQANIIKFYIDNYWNPFKLSQLVDQQVAENVYDEAVNQGQGIAPKHLQLACNNVIQHLGIKTTPLIVDGSIGLKTIATANELEGELVYNEINALRKQRYINTANGNPDLKQWLPVWLRRLLPYKHV